MMNSLRKIYSLLLKKYGPQGWWPLYNSLTNEFIYSANKKNKTNKQRLEISLGAILAQSVSWKNAEKALLNLIKKTNLEPDKIKKILLKEPEVIRPAGYFNQKARKILYLLEYNKIPNKRQSLLEIWGIGKETADSILLYAFDKPFFIVDAYARRFLSRLGLIKGNESYDDIQAFVQSEITSVKDLNEFHALIVIHSKLICKKKPLCEKCFFSKLCKKNIKQYGER